MRLNNVSYFVVVFFILNIYLNFAIFVFSFMDVL